MVRVVQTPLGQNSARGLTEERAVSLDRWYGLTWTIYVEAEEYTNNIKIIYIIIGSLMLKCRLTFYGGPCSNVSGATWDWFLKLAQ